MQDLINFTHAVVQPGVKSTLVHITEKMLPSSILFFLLQINVITAEDLHVLTDLWLGQ